MKKFFLSSLSILLYIVLLLSFYVLHVKFFQINVVFYAAIFDGVFAAVIAGLLIWKLKYFFSISPLDRYHLIIIWLLMGYGFAISVPTVIDRSLSFYILEKIQQRGGGVKQNALHDIFTKEYVFEHRLLDVRMTEQIESGTVKVEDGCVKLTPKGEKIAEFSRYFRQNWLPKRRLLLGEYTDDLTDPFRNSIETVNYRCK